LVARQTARWEPVLDWAERRLGTRPTTTTGVAALRQPAAFHGALRGAVEPFDDFRLAALHLATGVAGSVLLGLGLVEAEIDAETAFAAAMVDDLHQLDRWGDDAEARERLGRVRFDLDAAVRFVRLHDGE
jgi:chaperone required for assembly of F1-ATPase